MAGYSALHLYGSPPGFTVPQDDIVRCVTSRASFLAPLAQLLWDPRKSWKTKLREGTKYLRTCSFAVPSASVDRIAHFFGRMYWGLREAGPTSDFVRLEHFLFLCRWRVANPTAAEAVQLLRHNGFRVRLENKLPQDFELLVHQAAMSCQPKGTNEARTHLQFGQVLSIDWRKVPLSTARRYLFLRRGLAYFHVDVADKVVAEVLRFCLSKGLRNAKQAASEQKSMVWLLWKSGTCGRDPYLRPQTELTKFAWTKDGGQRAPKPPCIQRLMAQAGKTGHVGYKGRLLLVLWQKNIGAHQGKSRLLLGKFLRNENQRDVDELVKGTWKKNLSCVGCTKVDSWGLCPVVRKPHRVHCARLGDIEDLTWGVNSPAHFTRCVLEKRES